MTGRSVGWLAAPLAASMLLGAPAARAVDLELFSNRDRTCAYLARAGAEDVAKVEIWLTILQRDVANGDGRGHVTIDRGDLPRLHGEARTIETAIATIEAQIAQEHTRLVALRGRVRAIDALPPAEAAALRYERGALQAEMRATSEDLIEMSFDLRDAKSRLSLMRTALAGRRDTAAMIDAARSTVRLFGRAIRDCARTRRASLAAVPF